MSIENSTTEPIVNTQNEPTTPPVAEPVKTPDPKEDKKVSKTLYETTVNELVEAKKKLKAIEDAGKTAEQLKEDRIAQLEAEKKQILLENNQSKAVALTSESKSKINLDSKNTDFDEVLSIITSDNIDVTTKNATTLNKLLLAIYQKGIDDAQKVGMNSMNKGVYNSNSNSNSNNNNSTYGKKYAQQINGATTVKTDLFTKQIK